MPRPNVAAHPKRYLMTVPKCESKRAMIRVGFLPPNDASRACALTIGIAAFLLPRSLVPPATSPLRLAVMLVRLAVEAALRVRLAMEAATRLVRLAMEAATRLVRLAMEAATRPRVTKWRRRRGRG